MEIQHFKPDMQEKVRALILDGLAENFKDAFNPSENPDLDNIYDFYCKNGNMLFIGKLKGEIICSGALLKENGNTCQIVRLSVDKNYRCHGYGTIMVNHLIKTACKEKFMQIDVITNSDWTNAIHLYKKLGFKQIYQNEVDICLKYVIS